MKYLSRFMVKINNQLIITTTLIVLVILVTFGMLLPMSMKYLINNQVYSQLHREQEAFMIEEQFVGRDPEVYHYKPKEGHPLYNQGQLEPEALHHLMMYPDFFLSLQEEAMRTKEVVSDYLYKGKNEHIYYVINRTNPEDVLVSYKVDDTSEVLAHELMMNTLVLAVFIFLLMLIVFFKWINRLINNLKEIQGVLDSIEGDNLRNVIPTTNYTEEFQEVMCSLDRMRLRLYEEEETKQQMLHNISHDLKTPLAVIKNYAEGIIDGVYPYGTVEETAHVIYTHAERLEKKVKGLLYLNRLDYLGSRHEEEGDFEIGTLVQEVVGYMKDHEETYVIEVENDHSLFRGEREKWRIVIENLLDNAKRYTKTSIKITIVNEKIIFYNDGEAIDLPMQTKIFQPFEKGVDGVTGLGLAIVKKTVEMYDYEIEVQNKEVGVSFIIS